MQRQRRDATALSDYTVADIAREEHGRAMASPIEPKTAKPIDEPMSCETEIVAYILWGGTDVSCMDGATIKKFSQFLPPEYVLAQGIEIVDPSCSIVVAQHRM